MSIDKRKLSKEILLSLVLGAIIYFILSAYNVMVKTSGDYRIALHNTLDLGLLGMLSIVVMAVVVYVCTYHGDLVFKYRFVIAAVAFIVCVILGINGSSIECMYACFGSSVDTNVVAGVSRPVRSDEWAVLTPLTMSQYYGHDFSYYSEIVRGISTDVFIEYGTPIRNLIMIFRPFQIGYLFLPFANGLAFFWCGRFITLLMTSFEFGRLITKDNRRLSLAYAVMVVLAPAIQWWFAINGFVEMLIFSQLSIVLLKKYMTANNYVIRTICALFISVCAGGYVLTMYPSWMVPLAYAIVLLAIWVIIDNYKECKMTLKDIPIIVVAVIIFVIAMAYVLVNSFDTIKAIMGTVYPGARTELGGANFKRLGLYVTNILYPIYGLSPEANVCECAGIISFFPMGIIMYIIYTIKSKKKDVLSIVLIILSVFLFLWCSLGFPQILAKITMMSLSQASRTIVIFEFISLIQLIRSIHLLEEYDIKEKYIVLMSALITAIVVGMTYIAYIDSYSKKEVWLIISLVFFVLMMTLLSLKKKYSNICIIYIILFMLVTGGLVNPVRVGSNPMTDIDELKAVSNVVENDPDALWAVEGGFPLINSPIMVGARTINSTNVYPCIDRWKMYDEEGKYEDVYNRYAHITINIIEDSNETERFELVQADVFKLNVSIDDLKKLDVKYIFTSKEYSQDELELVNSVNNYRIYMIK